MIYKQGDRYVYGGTTYCVGDRIVGAENSEYKGLNGYIFEIRTENDKDTENPTADLYCEFFKPVFTSDIRDIEERFSKLYGTQKTIDDITLDSVILSPDEVILSKEGNYDIKLFIVTESWAAYGDYGRTEYVFSSYNEAKAKMNELLSEEYQSGCVPSWSKLDTYQCEETDASFECWLNGEYLGNHYLLTVKEITTSLSQNVFGDIGRKYLDDCKVEDFICQIESWDEVGRLSDAKYQELISDNSIVEQINKSLKYNDNYWEAYWDSVSEAAHEIVSKHIVQDGDLDV